MTMQKIVSLPGPLVSRARRAVREGRARKVSAYVTTALEEKSKLDELGTLLAERHVETGGPLRAKERREADRALGVGARAKAKVEWTG